MHPLPALFAAITTLLAPRAGDAGPEVEGAQDAGQASAGGEVHPLATTDFGRFVRDELRPFSEGLVGSRDIDDLERRMDEFVDGELADRMVAQALRLMNDGWSEEDGDTTEGLDVALAALRARLLPLLGERHAADLDEGFRLTLSVLAHAPLAAATLADCDAGAQICLSDALSDVNVPLERRQRLFAAMESSACYFALVHLAAAPRPVAPWLADELMKRWISGQAAALQQLAINADPQALYREELGHSLADDGYERLARQGAEAGADVWPPEVSNDD